MPTTNFTLTPNSGSSADWVNVSGAVGDDGSAATCAVGFASLYVNYDAASVIPTDATLGLVTITVKLKGTWTSGAPELYLREIGYRSFSDGSPFRVTATASYATYTFVSDTATALGLSVAQLLAGYLRFRTANIAFGSGDTLFVDHITFSVDWTAAQSSPTPLLFHGENF